MFLYQLCMEFLCYLCFCLGFVWFSEEVVCLSFGRLSAMFFLWVLFWGVCLLVLSWVASDYVISVGCLPIGLLLFAGLNELEHEQYSTSNSLLTCLLDPTISIPQSFSFFGKTPKKTSKWAWWSFGMTARLRLQVQTCPLDALALSALWGSVDLESEIANFPFCTSLGQCVAKISCWMALDTSLHKNNVEEENP